MIWLCLFALVGKEWFFSKVSRSKTCSTAKWTTRTSMSTTFTQLRLNHQITFPLIAMCCNYISKRYTRRPLCVVNHNKCLPRFGIKAHIGSYSIICMPMMDSVYASRWQMIHSSASRIVSEAKAYVYAWRTLPWCLCYITPFLLCDIFDPLF